MSVHLYEIWSYSGVSPFTLQGIVRGYDNFTYTRRYQASGNFSIHLGDESPALPLVTPGNILLFMRDGVVDFAGYSMRQKLVYNQESPKTLAEIDGLDLAGWLLRRRRATPPGALAYYSQTGNAEPVMKQIFNDFIANPTDPARLIIGSRTQTTTTSLGSSVVVNLRGERLDDVMSKVSLAGGPGFRVALTTDGALEFQVYTGVSRTETDSSPVVFNPLYHNLASFEYERNVLELENYLYTMGGDSSAGTRFQVTNTNTDSVNTWGRYEGFQDGRNATTTAIANLEAQSYLAPKVLVDRVSFMPMETAQVQYKRDWDLGDTVTVRYDTWGVHQNLPIVEVKVELKLGQKDAGGEHISVQTNVLQQDFLRHLRATIRSVQPGMFNPFQNYRSDGRTALIASSSAPTSPPPQIGDTYFDTTKNQTMVYTGSGWTPVPVNTNGSVAMAGLSADPTGVPNGSLYYDTVGKRVRVLVNGVWLTVSAA